MEEEKKPIKKTVVTVGSLISQNKQLSLENTATNYYSTTLSNPATNSAASTVSTYNGAYDGSNASSWTSAYDDYGGFIYTNGKINKDLVEAILSGIFENETDLVPLVKNYFIKYLDKVMEDPDEIIKEVIRAKDEEIKELKEDLKSLNTRLDSLTKLLSLLEEKVQREIGIDKRLGGITPCDPSITWTTSTYNYEVNDLYGTPTITTTTISNTVQEPSNPY